MTALTPKSSSADCGEAESSALVYPRFQIGSTASTFLDLRTGQILQAFPPSLFAAYATSAAISHWKASVHEVKDHILSSKFRA